MHLSIVFFFLISSQICLIFAKPRPIGLRASSTLRNLLFGTAIGVDILRNNSDRSNYQSNVTNNYNLVVPASELKAIRIWHGENIYDWNDPDWLLGSTENSTGWVQNNLMKIRGHNLVWPKDTRIPLWLLANETSITSDKAHSLLSEYIHTVVSRYRGKIPWWDVINEAIDDVHNDRPFNLRDSFWFRKLGPDFLKYAFIYAHEADPNTKLYYNDYNIHSTGFKTNQTIDLINWLRSEGAPVDGIGIQWHIDITTNVTRGDIHYQAAQQFIDQNLDFMVTELDISMPTKGAYPRNSTDFQLQGLIYRSILDYVLYFSPKCRAMLTWGFTDRYSSIPERKNYTEGTGLPLDWLYFPKPAYTQMQEELARILVDGIYRISLYSQPTKCLGVFNNSVELFDGQCNSTNQQWNISWLDDGTYRLSSVNSPDQVLQVQNATESIGQIQMTKWTFDTSQEWAFSLLSDQAYHIVPRQAWWRTMAMYNSSTVAIVDQSEGKSWTLTRLNSN